VYLTAQRLLAAAYKRHELLHMLAAPIAEQIQATLQGGAAYPRSAPRGARRTARIVRTRRTQRTIKRTDPRGRHTVRRRRRR
jgi:hypothetical protein